MEPRERPFFELNLQAMIFKLTKVSHCFTFDPEELEVHKARLNSHPEALT